jgi:hypothetical protein
MKAIKAALLISLTLNLMLAWIVWQQKDRPAVVIKTVADPSVDKVLQAYLENKLTLQMPDLSRTSSYRVNAFIEDLKAIPILTAAPPMEYQPRRPLIKYNDEPIRIRERHPDKEFDFEMPDADRGLYITPGAAGI